MSKRIRFILIIMLMAVLFQSCSAASKTDLPKVENGVIDLREFELDDRLIQLDGTWEFYWQKLLAYEELSLHTPDLYAEVPKVWNTYSINGKSLPGEGYGTYRLRVNTNLPEGTILGLDINTFSSAYKLFINEKEVAANGTVADNPKEEVGEYNPKVTFFEIPEDTFDIVIMVSNYEYARGGFWYSMKLGTAEAVMSRHSWSLGRESFIVGALLLMAVYSLAVFLMKRGTKFPLYYSIWCILLIFTLDTLDKLLLVKVLPGISLSAVIFIWYTASNWMIFFLLLMTHEFLPSGFSRWAVRVDLVIYSLLQLMMLITKPVIYSELSVLSKCVGIAGIFCTIGIVIIGIRNKQKEGWLFLCCITIIAITYIHDSFYLTNKINDGSLLYYGIFICSFIQVIIQINRVRNIINRMVSAELNFLQAQIKPHFLFNAINTFIALTYYNIDQARDLLKDFADYLKRSFDLKSKDRYVPLKNELELVRAYVNIEKVRFGRRLEVVFDVDQEYEGMVPILILQPVIENAILHGVIPKQDGGCVLVIIRKKNRELEFTVKDDGVGMPPEILEHLPENKDGVGLKNIMQRLEKLYRKGLSIHSIPGKGTEVSWSIPLDKRRRL